MWSIEQWLTSEENVSLMCHRVNSLDRRQVATVLASVAEELEAMRHSRMAMGNELSRILAELNNRAETRIFQQLKIHQNEAEFYNRWNSSVRMPLPDMRSTSAIDSVKRKNVDLPFDASRFNVRVEFDPRNTPFGQPAHFL